MSPTRTSETGTVIRTLQPGSFPAAAGGGDGFPLPFTGAGGSVIPYRLSTRFRAAGIDLSVEEFNELRVFEEFLDLHVQPGAACDVQCMLLWSEWVRTFRRQVSGFPALVREKEFRDSVTGRFRAEIATDGRRGMVFTGIRFVP